jgi:hypothetical protein
VEPWSCRAETKEKRPGLESRGPSARGAQRRVAERSEGMQRREHTQPRRDGRGRDATARERNAAIQHSLNGLRAPALCAVSNPSESSALPAGSRTSAKCFGHGALSSRDHTEGPSQTRRAAQQPRRRRPADDDYVEASLFASGPAVRHMSFWYCTSRSWSFPNACAAPVADAQPSDHSPPRSMRTSASADTDMPDPCHDAREFTVTGDSSTRARRQLQRNDDRRTDSTLC